MPNTTHNIILFGEAGSGKSSLVNMIVGREEARVSGSAEGCTFKNDRYDATINGRNFVIYDTAGLNEGEQGRIPHWKAIRELYTLIRQLDGVSLLIYCMRGRVRENARANWTLFNKVICAEKVPIIAVVTGLETYEDPDDWKREGNLDVLKRNRMTPKAVGCVVSFRGRQKEFADIYEKSQSRLRNLIMKYYLQKPWCEEKEKWFANIYSETFSTGILDGICFAPQTRVEYNEAMRAMINEFTKEVGMKKEDSEKLDATLLKAEKKVRKGGRRFFQP